MDGLIYRCSGWFQDADHGERLVIMFDKADLAGPVGNDDGIADVIPQRPGDFGPQDGIENAFEPPSTGKLQCTSAGKTEMVEIAAIRPHHAVALM